MKQKALTKVYMKTRALFPENSHAQKYHCFFLIGSGDTYVQDSAPATLKLTLSDEKNPEKKNIT